MSAFPPSPGQDSAPGSVAGDTQSGTPASNAPVPGGTAGSAAFSGALPAGGDAPAGYASPGGYGSPAIPAMPAMPANPTQQGTWADWAYFIKSGLNAGREPADILREMQFRGSPAQPSYALMHDVVQRLATEARKEMVAGLVVLVIGLGITLVTFEMASGGGTYFVLWAPVVFGLFYMFRGAWKWSKLPRY